MELDIIEVRAYNYFEYRKQVKRITEADMLQINVLLPELIGIPITRQRLTKIGFGVGMEADRGYSIKFLKDIEFRFKPTKAGNLVLEINNSLKLPHVQYIHQLQNIWYDLTSDLLVRVGDGEPPIKDAWQSKQEQHFKPVNGKYRAGYSR